MLSNPDESPPTNLALDRPQKQLQFARQPFAESMPAPARQPPQRKFALPQTSEVAIAPEWEADSLPKHELTVSPRQHVDVPPAVQLK